MWHEPRRQHITWTVYTANHIVGKKPVYGSIRRRRIPLTWPTWSLRGRLFQSASEFVPGRFGRGALQTLLDAKDLYWSSHQVDETELLLDVGAYFLGVLVKTFEWLPGVTRGSRLLVQESPGVEVSELITALAPAAKIR